MNTKSISVRADIEKSNIVIKITMKNISGVKDIYQEHDVKYKRHSKH